MNINVNLHSLPKSTFSILLLMSVIFTGSFLHAKTTEDQPALYIQNDIDDSDEFGEGEAPEYIFINNIPGSTQPELDATRLFLDFIGSNGGQKTVTIEPTHIGDPNPHEDALLNDDEEDLVGVNLRAIIYKDGMINEYSLGSYDPADFAQPGTFEFSLDENGDIVLTKDEVEIFALPA